MNGSKIARVHVEVLDVDPKVGRIDIVLGESNQHTETVVDLIRRTGYIYLEIN